MLQIDTENLLPGSLPDSVIANQQCMGVRSGDREAHGSPLNLQAKLKIINTKEDHRDEKKGKERKGEDFNYVSK